MAVKKTPWYGFYDERAEMAKIPDDMAGVVDETADIKTEDDGAVPDGQRWVPLWFRPRPR